MAHWLLKTEPSTYSFADLQTEKTTAWTGVANATALIHLRAMKKGDLCLIYHTGDEKQVIGLATVTREAYPDPAETNPKLVAVDIKAGKPLKRPVTLETIKGDSAFAGWDLLRIGRLSVVPTTAALYRRILELGN